MHNTLAKQNELIGALKAERASSEVKQKVEQDATLLRSEAHLNTALDELNRANETLQEAILN